MLLLQDTAASAMHSSYLQFNLALIRCSDITRGNLAEGSPLANTQKIVEKR